MNVLVPAPAEDGGASRDGSDSKGRVWTWQPSYWVERKYRLQTFLYYHGLRNAWAQ